jgi:hypothetical protein
VFIIWGVSIRGKGLYIFMYIHIIIITPPQNNGGLTRQIPKSPSCHQGAWHPRRKSARRALQTSAATAPAEQWNPFVYGRQDSIFPGLGWFLHQHQKTGEIKVSGAIFLVVYENCLTIFPKPPFWVCVANRWNCTLSTGQTQLTTSPNQSQLQ